MPRDNGYDPMSVCGFCIDYLTGGSIVIAFMFPKKGVNLVVSHFGRSCAAKVDADDQTTELHQCI